MEEFKLVVVEEIEFEKPDANSDNIFGIFGLSGIGSKEKTSTKRFKATVVARNFIKQGTRAFSFLILKLNLRDSMI